MKRAKYRIVKKYSSIFNEWYYTLEKKMHGKVLWLFPYSYWDKVAGHGLTTSIPVNWVEDLGADPNDITIIEPLT